MSKRSAKCRFPNTKIKKIMREDEEVGKMAAVVPVLMSSSLELFVSDLLEKAIEVAKKEESKVVLPVHLFVSFYKKSAQNNFSSL